MMRLKQIIHGSCSDKQTRVGADYKHLGPLLIISRVGESFISWIALAFFRS